MATETYIRPGSYKVVCDLSGFVFWDHETVIQWNGLRVGRRFADVRNPQDFAGQGLRERVGVSNARPEGDDVFLSPGDVTAADL